jgi:type I restriction enzyme S subunit
MSTVPRGWRCAALADVCEVVSGGTPRTGVAAYWDGDIPWLTPKDLALDKSQVVHGGARSITREGLANSSAKLFPAGSVIVSSRAPIGYVAIAGEQMGTNQGCKIAVPSPEIDSRYLYWFMLQARDDMEARASGTTFKEISGKEFGRTRLQWPELSEQRRIVEILEDHLSRLDAATAILQAARRRLQSMEASALSVARSGRELALAEVADIQGGIQKQPKRTPRVNAFPFLRVANVTARGLELDGVHQVELFGNELDRLRLEVGDLLVVEGNGSPSQIGRAATWDGSITNCVHQNHLIRVRPGPKLLPDYLEAVWNSPETRRELTDLSSSSSGLHTLSVSKLSTLHLPVPSLEAQAQVAAAIHEVRDSRRRLDVALRSSIDRGAGLRRALLAAAFSGRLT